MDDNSWLLLRERNPMFQLPEDLAASDVFGARDCGWVEQMRPFIRHFAPPAGLVVDPFNGFGTTLVAASLEGRRGIGIELEPSRAAIAIERLQRLNASNQTVLSGDLVELADSLPQADLILTNAPYFGCRWRGSGDAAAQLYSANTYADFIGMFYRVLKALKPALRDGGHFVVMAENLRIGPHFVPMAWDIGRMLAEHFTLLDERILLYERPAQALQPMDVQSNRSHEFALIAKKASRPVDLQGSLGCLRQLSADFPEVIVYGGFARWLADEEVAANPSDVDLLLPYNPERLANFARWFETHGFQVTRWGQPMGWTAAAVALDGAHYFRAQRLCANGELCVFDVCFEDAVLTYESAMRKVQRIDGLAILPTSRPLASRA